jgi:hypothetical protein
MGSEGYAPLNTNGSGLALASAVLISLMLAHEKPHSMLH